MSLLLNPPASTLCSKPWKPVNKVLPSPRSARLGRLVGAAKASIFNPMDQPIIKEALKEPVAFVGGMFAGALRLDLNEDPLKEWLTRTVEASGITEEEFDDRGSKSEETPQQIEIE